jgi:glycosyltransferase involved in cell wall biosynthesis
MIRLGARLAYTHLDSIAIRCEYLCGPNTRQLFKVTAEIVDLGFCISLSSKLDFERLYNIDSRFVVIPLGAMALEPSCHPGEFILLVGNAFPHKALDLAEKALAGIGNLVVLGGNDSDPAEGIKRFPSGELKRSDVFKLYDTARVVVFPSLYEGFGLPVTDALALGKNVVALDLDVNRELLDLTRSERLHLVPGFAEMRSAVAALMSAPPQPEAVLPQRTWREVALDYSRALADLLASPVNTELLRRRWDLMQTLEASKMDLEGRLSAEQAARLEWTAKHERERQGREALLDSYSWRITGPLRRLCDLGNRIWRPR